MLIEFSAWVVVEDKEDEDEMLAEAWEELDKHIKEYGTTIFSAFDENGKGL